MVILLQQLSIRHQYLVYGVGLHSNVTRATLRLWSQYADCLVLNDALFLKFALNLHLAVGCLILLGLAFAQRPTLYVQYHRTNVLQHDHVPQDQYRLAGVLKRVRQGHVLLLERPPFFSVVVRFGQMQILTLAHCGKINLVNRQVRLLKSPKYDSTSPQKPK